MSKTIRVKMNVASPKRLSRENWLNAAIRELEEHGIDGVKVVVLAKKLGSTSGSFYWHFKNQPALMAALLEYWEETLTNQFITRSKAFEGSPEERILSLMISVMEQDAASLDHAISVWARRDAKVKEIFERTIQKRIDHATWMFKKVGFSRRQAAIRGRLMVAYLMGESSTMLKSNRRWKSIVKEEFEVLMAQNV
ncbi:MAG: TetR/AcrR family transcriptional regulator [Hyphomicrobiales bacterium]